MRHRIMAVVAALVTLTLATPAYAADTTPPTAPGTPVASDTTGAPAPTCTVTYKVTSQWAGGFVTEVKITNTGATAITGWSLAWLFANGQQISNLWNGGYTQVGGNVTVTNMPYNATISAGGGSQTFGFLGASGAVNNVPNGFTLNGRSCQVA